MLVLVFAVVLPAMTVKPVLVIAWAVAKSALVAPEMGVQVMP